MPALLQTISFPSIYKVRGVAVTLPARMAHCSPDMAKALDDLSDKVEAKGGRVILSDLFRSYDMQFQAHLDFVQKRKTAFSPPPGGSLHEAGRAFDVDLGALKMPLKDFWKVAATCGLVPIIAQPTAGADESWHFECRGSHALVYDYYKAGHADNFDKPYKAMAASAILAAGVKVDAFGVGQDEAYVQSGLIRLGQTLGNIDGGFGKKTRAALANVGLATSSTPAKLVVAIDHLLQDKFPGEFFPATVHTDAHALT